jgi:hypothetical protein
LKLKLLRGTLDAPLSSRRLLTSLSAPPSHALLKERAEGRTRNEPGRGKGEEGAGRQLKVRE